MKTPNQYYKCPDTGIEMHFIFCEQWGWGVGFTNVDILDKWELDPYIPWPKLTEEQKMVVDRNYDMLYKSLEEEQ